MRQDTQDTWGTCLHWANMANDITNFAAIHKHSQLLLQTGGSLYMYNEYITSVFHVDLSCASLTRREFSVQKDKGQLGRKLRFLEFHGKRGRT